MTLAADVAQLKVQVDFTGNASSEINKIKTSLGGFGSAGGVASTALGAVERGATGMGNAFSHLKTTVGGLLTGPLGFIGLGAGIFSVAGALRSGITTANDMASAIEKLAPLTGDTAEQVSSLLAVFNKFGISTDTATTRIAFMEKAVGTLALSSKNAAKFQKEFGFSILDASGHVKDANTLILQAADYWNGAASASQKAAFEAKLFGRGFADMIPILNLGSKGIKDAELAAQSLGLTLTATNVQDLQKYQATMRDLGDTVGGLQLQLSLALVPALEDVAKAATSFISSNRAGIVSFFKDLIASARTAAGFITGTIIPDLKSLAGAAASFWNSIPGPLRDILVKGFIADRAMKFLFGFDPVTTIGSIIGKQLISSLTGGIGSVVASTLGSKAIPQDVFVVNMAPGFGGGIGGEAAGGGEAVAAGGAGAAVGGIGLAIGAAAGVAITAYLTKELIIDKPTVTSGGGSAGKFGALPGSAGQPIIAAINNVGSRTVNELSAIKQDSLKDISLGGAILKAQQETAQRFRSGTASMVIKDFPKELGYLSTATDAQKNSAVRLAELRQDISTLKAASVNATDAQKKVLDHDIGVLQGKVDAVTAAVKAVNIKILENIQNVKDQGSSIKVTTTTTHKSTTTAKAKTNRVGGP